MILTEALAGTLTGVVGSLATNVFNFFTQKQKNKHELETRKLDIEEMTKEHELGMQKLELKGQIANEKMAGEAFKESIKDANKTVISNKLLEKLYEYKGTIWLAALLTGLLGFVEVLRTSVRPVITYAFAGAFIYFASEYGTFQNGALLEGISYVAFTTIGWWFADRRMAKHASRMNGWNTKK